MEAALANSRKVVLNTQLLPAVISAILMSAVAGLALSRLLYEGLFPQALWLGRPAPALLLALGAAVIGWLVWRPLARRLTAWPAALIFLPFLLNLAYLRHEPVDPVRSRFFFAAGLWLAVALAAHFLARPATWRWLGFALLIALFGPLYLLTMGQSVGQADTFEFQVVVPKLGIVHPTGYPLFLLLSKLFTFIPLNSMAWRVNLAAAVFALAAVCLVYLFLRRLLQQNLPQQYLPSLLAATLLGLSPTFWSQAVQAEVYSLQALIAAAALVLMREIGGWRLSFVADDLPSERVDGTDRLALALVFTLGLGLAHHLTTLLLLPPAVVTLWLARDRVFSRPDDQTVFRPLLVTGLRLLIALLLPLLLYAYLPIRWQAVNGEPMGLARFVDWIIGGRFQDALQLQAWLTDLTRYQVVGRLLRAEWSAGQLIWMGLGFVLLLWRQWRVALFLALAWAGHIFYALNYYVPDLAVFIIPAHLVMAVYWGAGLAGLVVILEAYRSRASQLAGYKSLLAAVLMVIFILPGFITAAIATWPGVNAAGEDGRTAWARAVLALPLDPNGAILADSDKFPPLYYLQQAEGIRPEMDIMVLPDEAAYRQELDSRLRAGQTVYLARFLPGLEGIYHLRSAGPLTEVSQQPLTSLPAGVRPLDLAVGPAHLVGYELVTSSPLANGDTALTLYWQAAGPIDRQFHVYTRWFDDQADGQTAAPVTGQHPANNYYPTVAWKDGELIPDFHVLPQPVSDQPQEPALQVAVGEPFSRPDDLPWQTVARMTLEPAAARQLAQPLRQQYGPLLVSGTSFPTQLRPQSDLTVWLTGCGPDASDLMLNLVPAGDVATLPRPVGSDDTAGTDCEGGFTLTRHILADQPAGSYDLVAGHPQHTALCGWLSSPRSGCSLGQLTLSGAPLPAGATNFEDKIGLLSIDVPKTTLQPGGRLAVELTWQGLAPMESDYTVFVQVLDQQDRIVGQVDSWPLQGTFPTSQWSPGQIVRDPYLVQLSAGLEEGPYRLQVGWYMLATLRRLAVLDESGSTIDDKVTFPGLIVGDPEGGSPAP
jgi:hypothetical protein